MEYMNRATLGGYIHIFGQRLPVYILPDIPFWFLPTSQAGEVISLADGKLSRDQMAMVLHKLTGKDLMKCLLAVEHLLQSITLPPFRPYKGRAAKALGGLEELWLHITDMCNLRCRHCLFANDLGGKRRLAPQAILSVVDEAYQLGARLICFTGGEPFTYPEFMALLKAILRNSDIHVAILTNGVLLEKYIPEFEGLDKERVHLQISIDGPEQTHDQIRGKGTYLAVTNSIKRVIREGIPCSLAMAVNSKNASNIVDMVHIAELLGVNSLHLQWHLNRGLGSSLVPVEVSTLAEEVTNAAAVATELGVSIDNFDAIASQIFSPPGTRYDLGNACWQSLAIGPDGAIYPTPAMVDRPNCRVGDVSQGLEKVWKESPMCEAIRRLSLIDCTPMKDDPWAFLIGGGDIDHCLELGDNRGPFARLNADPYAPIYKAMALFVIEKEAEKLTIRSDFGTVLRMGDVSSDCPSGDDVNFIHCNCLLSLPEADSRSLVKAFYADRAMQTDDVIFNPVELESDDYDFIPEEARVRMYGCGSPASDAQIRPGQTVLDLGSGAGVECFMASKKVGDKGLVIGLDMTQEMLDIAQRSLNKVSKKLGYLNIIFLKGHLESIPLADRSVDIVISNCVINLTNSKRRVLCEIFRVLKPGGRIVISDVVTEHEPSPAMRANHQLIGECLGGALVEKYLFALLRDIGFEAATVLKRFPYRKISEHQFYSLTFSANKPLDHEHSLKFSSGLYAGPFYGIITEDLSLLSKGSVNRFPAPIGSGPGDMAKKGLLFLDENTGNVTNAEMSPTCSCFELGYSPKEERKSTEAIKSYETGCLICGAPVVYPPLPETHTCSLCGSTAKTNALCSNGHFICDLCHIKDPLKVIKRICTTSKDTDMIRIMKAIRAHKSFPIHGPEHHAMIPGIILKAYKNLGGDISQDSILAGIDRGSIIPGGACGFMGSCGAAIGVGIAFSIILEATPLTPRSRNQVQTLVSKILHRIGKLNAARCCQRESYLALVEAARASKMLLPLQLRADQDLLCTQYPLNKECIKRACQLYPKQLNKKAKSTFPVLGSGI